MELNDAAYDAEDVLGEYHYKLLERQAREKYWKAASNLFSFASDASYKLKVITSLENLDRVTSGMDAFIQLLGLNNFDTISHSGISIEAICMLLHPNYLSLEFLVETKRSMT